MIKVSVYFYGNILGVTELTQDQIRELEKEDWITIKLVDNQ